MGPHVRAPRYAPGDIIYILLNILFYFFFFSFLFFSFLSCSSFYLSFYMFFMKNFLLHLFISYTSEPAKGTFILAAVGRSGTLFWGGPGGGGGGGRGGDGRDEARTPRPGN